MSETTKQEGEFSLKGKLPKKEETSEVLATKEPIKVKFESKAEVPEVTKVVIKKEEENAVQEQTTDEAVLQDENPKVELQEVVEGNKKLEEVTENEEVITIGETVSQEKDVVKEVTQVTEKATALPENIEKLVEFMNETGGTIEDYSRLNADYSNVDNDILLKEYYKQTKSHLESDEISFLLEDAFDFDEDIDEERDIRKKKLAKKEEVAKAKKFLNGLKDQYYSEIKLRPGTTKEQSEATEFFNRYNEGQKTASDQHKQFIADTKKMFSQDFKGFDIKVGEKSFRYGVQNTEKIAENQSNINNLIGKFLNDKGDVVDTKGYHKAIYAAENVDTIAKHFYEQGKADAIKDVTAKSKNINTDARQTTPSDINVGGIRVKAISGIDSSKLRIKKRF
mgnify:FL=1|tara:strand:+ start:1304 stop:2485 length:1182 start_codon:yes stop_codon:yes gene_type:complete